MRGDGEPVRPGMRTTHPVAKASKPAFQYGTLFADPIRASSLSSAAPKGRRQVCIRPTRPNLKSMLATREPSRQATAARAQYGRRSPKAVMSIATSTRRPRSRTCQHGTIGCLETAAGEALLQQGSHLRELPCLEVQLSDLRLGERLKAGSAQAFGFDRRNQHRV